MRDSALYFLAVLQSHFLVAFFMILDPVSVKIEEEEEEEDPNLTFTILQSGMRYFSSV